MMMLIRAMLVLTLGAGVNVLCTDAWADDPAATTRTHASAPPPVPPVDAQVEPIWNTPA